MAPVTVADALTAFALFFYGIAFIVLGMMALGKGKPDGAGTIFKLVGIVNGILGFIILWTFIGSPVFVSVGFLLVLFAVTWAAAGIINVQKYDLMPLGNAGIYMGLMMLPFAAFFALGIPKTFSLIGGWWLTICCLSWAWAFWSVTLASHGKIKLPVVGWTFLIQSFYTLWLPAALLLIGAVSVLP